MEKLTEKQQRKRRQILDECIVLSQKVFIPRRRQRFVKPPE